MLQLLIVFRSHLNLVHIQLYEWWHPLHSCAIPCAWHSQMKCGSCFRRVRGGFVCVGWGGGGGAVGMLAIIPAGVWKCLRQRSHMAWSFFCLLPHDFVGFLDIHHTPSPLLWPAWHPTCTHNFVGFPDISMFRLDLSSVPLLIL